MIAFLALVVVGIGVVGIASDQFVLGASRLARTLGVPAVVVGVVLMGFGSSLPEMAVSALAAREGEGAVALGNVAGSNLANISLLLGVGALISPIAVPSSAVRREFPLVLAAAALLVAVVFDGVSVAEGVVLSALMVGVLVWLLRMARAARDDVLGRETDEHIASVTRRARVGEPARALAGLVGTVVGSQLLLSGAFGLAELLGLTSGVVGVVLLALGTSLPELVTVVQSVRRDEHDLVVGNLLGSNLFNSLGVTGLVGVLGGAAADSDVTVSAVAGLALTVVVGRMLFTGRRVTRREAVVLFAAYGVLLVFVVSAGS